MLCVGVLLAVKSELQISVLIQLIVIIIILLIFLNMSEVWLPLPLSGGKLHLLLLHALVP